MNFYILLVISIIFFTLFTFARRINDTFVLIAVAIGCACNANLFTPLNMPINIGPFIFGMDSILYTLFFFTIIIRAIKYSIKDAKVMTITAVVAIIISGLIELCSLGSYNGGFKVEFLLTFSKYIFSVIGTLVGVWLMLLIFDIMSKKNIKNINYLAIYLGIIIACLINSIFYYVFVIIVNRGFSDQALSIALGSCIGRLFCIHLAMLSYFIYEKFLDPNKKNKGIEEDV